MVDNPRDIQLSNIQNFNPSIEDLSKEINKIDNFRCNSDISDVRNGFSSNREDKNFLRASIKELVTSVLPGETTPLPYESRCHAFYRSIGLPVVDPVTKSYFNPGFDPKLNTDQNKIEKYVNISNNFINSDLGKVSLDRQEYLIKLLDIFSNLDINGTVLTLSLINKRNYNVMMEKNAGEIFNLTLDDQKYIVDYTDVNGNDMLNYRLFPNENPPNKLLNFNEEVGRKHIIRPFITDPRICFTVPSNKQFKIPFLKEPCQYPQTFLEKVCISRFFVDRTSKYFSSSELSQISSNQDPNSKEFIKKLSVASENAQQTVYQNTFINFASALNKKIKENLEIIRKAQKSYHFLFKTNANGPAYGMNLNPISAQDAFYNTELDEELVILANKCEISNIELNILSLINKKQELPTTFTGSLPTDIFEVPTEKLPGAGDNLRTSLNYKSKIREKIVNEAFRSLVYLEYALGEFSGFGLIDVLAIKYSFYFISKEALFGLLDLEAQERMKSYPNVKIDFVPKDIESALKELENQISAAYKTLQEAFDKSDTL